MSALISALGDLFTFLSNQLTNIANFFTSSTIGMVILGIAIFGVVFEIVSTLLSKIHK